MFRTMDDPSSSFFGGAFQRYKGDNHMTFKLMQVVAYGPFDHDTENCRKVHYQEISSLIKIHVWFMFTLLLYRGKECCILKRTVHKCFHVGILRYIRGYEVKTEYINFNF